MKIEAKVSTWRGDDQKPKAAKDFYAYTLADYPDQDDPQVAGICVVVKPKSPTGKTVEVIIDYDELVAAVARIDAERAASAPVSPLNWQTSACTDLNCRICN